MKRQALLAFVTALGCILVALASYHHSHRRSVAIDPPADMDPAASSDSITLPLTSRVALPPAPPSTAIDPAVAAVAMEPSSKSVSPPAALPAAISAAADASAEEIMNDLIPRLALSFVGADEEAEMIWALAINDPDRPAEERKNLIEDLNEDGFPDPKHLTPEDLPLVLNRLQLIEELAPFALDDVNAAAFAEAHKDLEEMLDRLLQSTSP